MTYKRVLTVQDISCVGKCSTTVALPILSACGHETSILPTAILSTHTGGFSKPVVHHMGEDIRGMWSHWEREGISFDGILTGYLGSITQIENALEMTDRILTPGGVLIVDPAMADHGKLYSGLSEEYAEKMKLLCKKADILMPNITEAAMLSGHAFQAKLDEMYVSELLMGLGCSRVILTGVGYREGYTGVTVYDNGEIYHYEHPKAEKNYHGTGDIFAAGFTGALLRGKSIQESAKIAADFTAECIFITESDPSNRYGVKFEPALSGLILGL